MDYVIFAVAVNLSLIYGYYKNKHSQRSLEIPEYKAAGVAFTNGKHILSGYHPQTKKRYISGIGGSREKGETYPQTAFREMLEEVFNYNHIPPELISTLNSTMIPRRVVNMNKYIIMVYSFEDLENMLEIISRYKLKTKLYEKFPKTLHELVMDREVHTSIEISHLSLLPVVKKVNKKGFIYDEFIDEITQVHYS